MRVGLDRDDLSGWPNLVSQHQRYQPLVRTDVKDHRALAEP